MESGCTSPEKEPSCCPISLFYINTSVSFHSPEVFKIHKNLKHKMKDEETSKKQQQLRSISASRLCFCQRSTQQPLGSDVDLKHPHGNQCSFYTDVHFLRALRASRLSVLLLPEPLWSTKGPIILSTCLLCICTDVEYVNGLSALPHVSHL